MVYKGRRVVRSSVGRRKQTRPARVGRACLLTSQSIISSTVRSSFRRSTTRFAFSEASKVSAKMAPRRQKVIARSITHSILNSDRKPSFLSRLPAYFYIYWLTYECVEESLFKSLRAAWEIDEGKYRESFEGKQALSAMGDMGYSGSTFFSTRDEEYLVKSVPRRFEHTYFRDDLLHPYAEHVSNNSETLLIRITEFLQCSQHSIGTILGLAPSHHIVMENIKRDESKSNPPEGEKWESWDLKVSTSKSSIILEKRSNPFVSSR